MFLEMFVVVGKFFYEFVWGVLNGLIKGFIEFKVK